MITVSTTMYQFASGRAPRGFGVWGFFLISTQSRDLAWFRGSYAECKRMALSEAGRRGNVYRIEVAA